MKISELNLRTKLLSQGFIPLILLAILASFAIYSVGLLLRSVYEVDRTHKTIRKALEVRESASDMQTGMRGFLLTGEEKFLQEFLRGDNRIGAELNALITDSGDPELAKLLEEARGVLLAWKLEVADPAIALRKEIGTARDMNDMSDFVRDGMAKQHYEKFRANMEVFIGAEKAALVARQKEQARERDPMRLRDVIAAVDYGNMVIGDALQVLILVDELHRTQLWYVLSGRNEFLAPYQNAKKKAFAMIQQVKESVADSPEQVKLLDEGAALLDEWIKSTLEPETQTREEITKSKTMVDMKAYVSKGEDKIRFDKFKQLMDAFRAKEDALMASRQEAADGTAALTRKVLLIGAPIVAVVSLLISVFLSGRITRPLVQAMGLAESIGAGDLSRTLEVHTGDEVGRLCSALNLMVERLRDQTREILEGVSVLAASAAEISATVSEVATSSAQTSAAVTETTTTISQLKQSAKLASDKARNVAESSQQAAEVSESGKKATEDTVRRMNLIKEQMGSIGETVVRLSEHSQAIEDIIATVQDLADQSNLLAVNASIEAARAGEQGKGFAVVAHEIKTLADESRQATAQVRTILEDTRRWVSAVVMATEQGSKAVDAGVDQSAVTGEAIYSLSGSVVASAQVATVIQATSEQQFTGVDQVAGAMASIQQAVQQNSEGIARLEAAAQKLSGLGDQLKRLVGLYKI